VLARQEAEAAGADDAVLLNTRGDVAEATAATIVLFLDGNWVTPRVADGALPGIARGLLLEAGHVVEARIAHGDLARAEAGFLVNSLGRRVVRAVGEVDLNVHPLAVRALDDT
jgi:branched-chain amino acid aminotransferase